MDTCTYSPQISPGNTNLTAIPSTGPTLVRRETVLLEYPYSSPTTTLEVRNPEFNDKVVLQVSRVQRYTRDFSLDIYRDAKWPKTVVLGWNFVGLSRAKADEIIAFCQLCVGKEIKITDFDSRILKCIMTRADNPITQEGPNCLYTWKCDLQGDYV